MSETTQFNILIPRGKHTTYPSSVGVIIPTRSEPLKECLKGVELNTPPITSISIITDEGWGQTRIRYEGALASKANYVLLLDDDVFMYENVVQTYLNKIEEDYDAVCGSTNPAPANEFSRKVARYMTNPATPFYPVGCTLWRREKFIQIMNEVGVDINRYLGDNRLSQRIIEGGYKVFRCADAVSDHIWCTTRLKFFKKRLAYGAALGEMYLQDKTFTRNYLKFLASIPLSTNEGIYIYRLATWLGMTHFILRRVSNGSPR